MEAPQDISGSEIRNFLTRRLGDKEADEIMTYINTEVNKQVSEKVDLSEKQFSSWKDEMKIVFASKEDAQSLQKKLVGRVSKAEGTLILWAFVFWITLLIAVLCFLKFFK